MNASAMTRVALMAAVTAVTDLPFAVALAQGALIFVPFDLIKVALAALVAVAAAAAITPSRPDRGSGCHVDQPGER